MSHPISVPVRLSISDRIKAKAIRDEVDADEAFYRLDYERRHGPQLAKRTTRQLRELRRRRRAAKLFGNQPSAA